MNDDIREKKFNSYAHLAKQGAGFTEQNGRYPAQEVFEKFIVDDVLKKLKWSPYNRVLDIGCGMGTVLIPASFYVSHITGIDHPAVIERLSSVFKRDNCRLIGSDFLETSLDEKFDRILAYGVLPALPDQATVMLFIDKILSLLDVNGLALLGDFPNTDKSRRFTASRRGQSFNRKWDTRKKNMPRKTDISEIQDLPAPTFDDAFIMNICGYIRKKGFNAYIVNQPQNLPFGNTREDIIVTGPEYDDGTQTYET